MSVQVSCSKSRQQEVNKIQNNAIRLISGGLRSTPTAAAEVITNIEPLDMRREKATIETYERCKRMPTDHPGRKLVDSWTPTNRIKHKSILHHVQQIKEKTKLPDEREPMEKQQEHHQTKLCLPQRLKLN